MAESTKCLPSDQQINREAPQLIAVLKEMKEGLDTVKNKVQALTAKVKAHNFPTMDGISYLEAKHLLLLNYCQSLVYYLLRKAKGNSVQKHPVVRSLVELRLFLEKIRPIDKKLQYQIQKLTRATETTVEKPGLVDNVADETKKREDLLKYRPNPDLLVSKTNATLEVNAGVYRPPKFAPSTMDDDKLSRQERNALRKEKEILRQANQSAYVRDLLNDIEGRPEEVRENLESESREMANYISKMDERARQEEELFVRAPITKVEKKKMKYLMKSSSGLRGLTENFYDEIKTLPIVGSAKDGSNVSRNAISGDKKLKKRKNTMAVALLEVLATDPQAFKQGIHHAYSCSFQKH